MASNDDDEEDDSDEPVRKPTNEDMVKDSQKICLEKMRDLLWERKNFF